MTVTGVLGAPIILAAVMSLLVLPKATDGPADYQIGDGLLWPGSRLIDRHPWDPLYPTNGISDVRMRVR